MYDYEMRWMVRHWYIGSAYSHNEQYSIYVLTPVGGGAA